MLLIASLLFVCCAIGLSLLLLLGRPLAIFSTALTALFLLHFTLIRFGDDLPYSGIASHAPSIQAYGAVLIGGAVIALFSRSEQSNRGGTLLLPLIVYLAIGAALWWQTSQSYIQAGLLVFFVAICAWLIGSRVGNQFSIDDWNARVVSFLTCALVLFEGIVSLAQALGFAIFPVDAKTAELTLGRVNGTFGHPAALGKFFFISLLIILPMTQSRDATIRKLSYVALAAGLLATALSGSRANSAAVASMIVIWAVLLPTRNRATGEPANSLRFALLTAVLVAASLAAGTVVARFEEDPRGGARDHFVEVALKQIARAPTVGAGPNGYVAAAGSFDPLTAEGWPVHNIFLLATAEIGLIGAVLLYLPFIFMLVLALSNLLRLGRAEAPFSLATVAFAPGFIIVGITGWGFLSGEALPFLFLISAIVVCQLQREQSSKSKFDIKGTTAIVA